MIKGNIVKDATEVLNRSAVTFETHRRYNNQDAWPFLYPFIPKPYLATDVLNDGKGLLGITVLPGERKTISIQTDRDTVYRMLNVKYTPFRCSLGERIIIGEGVAVTITAGSATVEAGGVGVAEAFSKGDYVAWLDDNGNIQNGVVNEIIDNDTFTLEQPATTTATSVSIFLCVFKWYDTVPAQERDGNISADLTGTITTTVGSNALVGVGTLFTTEVIVGEILTWLAEDGERQYGQVATITNNTNIVLEDPATNAATANVFGILNALQGIAGIAAGTAALVGVGTEFVTDLTVGDVVRLTDISGQPRQFIIATITTAILATVTETLAADDPGFVGTTLSLTGLVQTGTITVDATNRLVTGVNTLFNGGVTAAELKEGDFIFYADAAGVCQRCHVSDIVSDTELKSTQEVIASGAGVTYALGRLTHRGISQTLTGTVSIAGSSALLVGVGTSFTTELTVGQKIMVEDSAGANILVQVSVITSDTAITLTEAIGTDAVPVLTLAQAMGTIIPRAIFRFRPLTQFIRVSIIMSSLQSRYLYGGNQEFLIGSGVGQTGLQERPHLLSALQGADDGLGQLRTSMVFAYDSSIKIVIHNLYTESLLVNGTLFGYKISLGE